MTYNIRFLPSLARILHPLYKLVQKDVTWIWSHSHKKAFNEAKNLVSTAPVLAHYDITKQLKLYCDASPRGVGACLMQVMDKHERPVAYASRMLTSAEANYAQIERKALAIIFAVKKFHQYLYGRCFILVTDHRPLCKILGHNRGVPSLAAARMQRWALILSAYQYTLQYIPGQGNQCADCMSQLPVAYHTRDIAEYMASAVAMDIAQLPVTSKDIAKATCKDCVLAVVLQSIRHGNWSTTATYFAPYFRSRTELSCEDGCILWGQRIVVPKALQAQLLQELHEGHFGVCHMKALARSYIWWPGLDRDVEVLAASYEACKGVSAMLTAAPRHPWQHPNSPWDRVHIDFGEWHGRHFLVVVDAYSKWPEVRYMSSTTAPHKIEVLKDIFATHGYPRLLVSDNGPQLTANHLENYLLSHHVLHHKSAPYHPATYGLAETW